MRVQRGGRVEIQDDAFPEGAEAEVIVLLLNAMGDGAATNETTTPPSLDDLPTAVELDARPPLPLDQLAGSVSRPQRTVDEIDPDLRALRDEWDRSIGSPSVGSTSMRTCSSTSLRRVPFILKCSSPSWGRFRGGCRDRASDGSSPRGWGEAMRAGSNTARSSGSSPRGWGEDHRVRGIVGVYRFIPTRVGRGF